MTRRPAGSAPPQKRHSPAGGVVAETPATGREAGGDGIGARIAPEERAPGGGGGMLGALARGAGVGGAGGATGGGGTLRGGGDIAPLERGEGELSIGPAAASARRTASGTSTTREAANSR